MVFGCALRKKGFTLVELLIVVIIVGILASVAIPLITGNIIKAKQAECDAALGTIRTGMRLYYAQYRSYPTQLNGAAFDTAANINAINEALGIYATDIDGTYFDHDDYVFQSVTANTYTVRGTKTVDGRLIRRQIDHEGNLGDY